MNYTSLTSRIADICEDSFTADQLAMFTQQAEQKIHNAVHFPALRKTDSTIDTVASTTTITIPTDLNYVNSLAVLTAAGVFNYLVQVDASFIREAYPQPTTTGVPKYYAHYNETTLMLGPTPDDAYDVELDYGFYPESIVTATTTWLGDHFDAALLNGALVEAIRFQKGEPDMVAMYEKMYMQSLALLKQLADGRMKQDTYLEGQPKTKVG